MNCSCCGQQATFWCVGCNAPCADHSCACSCWVDTPTHPSICPAFGLPPATTQGKGLSAAATEEWRLLQAEQAGKWLESLVPTGAIAEADIEEADKRARSQVSAWYRWQKQAEQRGIA